MSDDKAVVPMKTPFGTIVRTDWDREFYNRVLLTEKFKKRAICGMAKADRFPCSNLPKERYAFTCAIHKINDEPYDKEIKDGLTENRDAIKKRKENVGLFDLEYIQAMFARCNNCKIRETCTEMSRDSHCSLEEGSFFNFIDDIMKENDFTTIEMPNVFQLAIAFVSNKRNRLIQGMTRPDDDFYASFGIMAMRESMEYRKAQKSLGLTREHRKRVTINDSQSIVNDGINSIADLMSADDVEIEQTKTTIRRRSNDESDS